MVAYVDVEMGSSLNFLVKTDPTYMVVLANVSFFLWLDPNSYINVSLKIVFLLFMYSVAYEKTGYITRKIYF